MRSSGIHRRAQWEDSNICQLRDAEWLASSGILLFEPIDGPNCFRLRLQLAPNRKQIE